jgi:protein-disulfide isomerase
MLTSSGTVPPSPRLVMLGSHVQKTLDGAGVILGTDSTVLTVRIVGDYECAGCEELDRTVGVRLRSLAREGRIRYQLVNAPLRAHRRARKAAAALFCAENAGQAWAMHELLRDRRERWGWGDDPRAAFVELAEILGLERAAFDRCLDAPTTRSRMAVDSASARELGVESVPVILVGNTLVRPARSYQEVLDYVEDRLRAGPGASETPTTKAPKGQVRFPARLLPALRSPRPWGS